MPAQSSWETTPWGYGQYSPLVESPAGPQSASVTNSAAQVLASNPLARRRVFTNTSATVAIYLAFNGNTATAGYGETLLPYATLEMTPQLGNLNQGAVSAVTAAGSATLAFKEEI